MRLPRPLPMISIPFTWPLSKCHACMESQVPLSGSSPIQLRVPASKSHPLFYPGLGTHCSHQEWFHVRQDEVALAHRGDVVQTAQRDELCTGYLRSTLPCWLVDGVSTS